MELIKGISYIIYRYDIFVNDVCLITGPKMQDFIKPLVE
jgi:hypothetical protein